VGDPLRLTLGGRGTGRTVTAIDWPVTVAHEYALFAVINHVGTLESGHYITYVLDHAHVCWQEPVQRMRRVVWGKGMLTT
jgi:uncharacterized UBP type Zn finger protein